MDAFYDLLRNAARQGLLPGMFEHAFMSRAMIAATIIAPVLGGMGTLAVARRLAFFTQTVGHAALTGVALGLMLGEPLDATYAGLFGFSVLVAVLVVYLQNRRADVSDTVIGVVLAQTLGLGIILLVVVTKRFDVHQIEAMLFGSLLTLTDADLGMIAAAGLAGAATLFLVFNPFMLACISPSIARVRGFSSVLLEYVFVVMFTVVIVASLKLVGALLVLALVVLPAAAAGNIAQGLASYFWYGVVLATIGMLSGIAIASLLPIPVGAAVVVSMSVIFYATWLVGTARGAIVGP